MADTKRVPTTRRFNGKVYKWEWCVEHERQAREVARSLRQQKRLAVRVVNIAHLWPEKPWALYSRPRARRA